MCVFLSRCLGSLQTPGTKEPSSMLKMISNDNADATAYSILIARGFELRREIDPEVGVEFDVATSENCEYWGITPVDILGLIEIRKERGDHWEPSKAENKLIAEYDKTYKRYEDADFAVDVAARILAPKTITHLVFRSATAVLSPFAMIAFGAIYVKDYLVVQSPLSLLILPLSLYGIWMAFKALDRIVEFYLSKIFSAKTEAVE